MYKLVGNLTSLDVLHYIMAFWFLLLETSSFFWPLSSTQLNFVEPLARSHSFVALLVSLLNYHPRLLNTYCSQHSQLDCFQGLPVLASNPHLAGLMFKIPIVFVFRIPVLAPWSSAVHHSQTGSFGGSDTWASLVLGRERAIGWAALFSKEHSQCCRTRTGLSVTTPPITSYSFEPTQ